jgi:hypothetical protein
MSRVFGVLFLGGVAVAALFNAQPTVALAAVAGLIYVAVD